MICSKLGSAGVGKPRQRNSRGDALWRLYAGLKRALACGCMSTIEEVRAAEKLLQEILQAMKKAGGDDTDTLTQKLMAASEEYAGAVRELK